MKALRILVVEDEAMVAEVLVEVMEEERRSNPLGKAQARTTRASHAGLPT
jgi:CheY-like chemotaxis protein